ncbi:MAG: 2-oxo-tetronate isomerase [Betaproteobacteria bacterium]
MPRFAANLSMMYTEVPFLERFGAAAGDGFQAVEYLFPYAWSKKELNAHLRAHGLQQVLFNAPPGGTDRASIAAAWETGDRGTACIPGREAEFQFGVTLALDYADALDCPRIHCMAGLADPRVAHELRHATYVSNLRWAASQAARAGREVLIEPINTRDIPGYYLNRQDQAHALLEEVGAANLKVQMDLYHCQVVEGDLASKIARYLPTGRVAHFQIAGVPQRQEPDAGEVNYPYLFHLIDELGYEGWIGCEYRPRLGGQARGTRAGLGWLKKALA